MKTILITLAIASLITSSTALACEKGVQRGSSTEVKNVPIAPAVRTPIGEAAAPAAQHGDKSPLPETQTQQPDPLYLPYVNNGWYGN
ncbi:MAG: hypothetical protein K6T56_06495 [Burkholderiales bacterium]|nr:hypothetical protein [Burkholderiales bacterium]